METYLIEGKSKGLQVLISAGVHGDEYEPVMAAWRLINLLPKRIVSGKVIVCPIVNANAFLKGSREGDDGLDLARICPGNPEGSDSEIAAAQISSLIHQADYYIDLHTGGSAFDIIPLAGYMLHTAEAVLASQRMMATAFNLPVIWGTDCRPNGRTLSVARDYNVPAIYAEYGGGKGISEKVIRAYVKGCMNILIKLGMLSRPSKTGSKWKYWVEDYMPDSGFLQGKLPSPAKGTFIPKVKLGEMVQKGQKWGLVIDLLNGNSVEAEADKDGMVMMIRTAALVNTGDSLGGVLPINRPGKLIIHEK